MSDCCQWRQTGRDTYIALVISDLLVYIMVPQDFIDYFTISIAGGVSVAKVVPRLSTPGTFR